MMGVIVKSAKERMIESAVVLMRERGVGATSFSEVLAHSGAPRGSIYHHFPEGKAQLIAEATRWAGRFIAAGEKAALKGDDPRQAVEAAYAFWHALLTESDFGQGCPVVAATVSAEDMPVVRDAAAEAFRSWEEPIADSLERNGVPPDRARALATLTIASFEGAVIMARAQRSLAPIEHVAAELRAAVGAALA
jgi:AcrR family transcriptional regulator